MGFQFIGIVTMTLGIAKCSHLERQLNEDNNHSTGNVVVALLTTVILIALVAYDRSRNYATLKRTWGCIRTGYQQLKTKIVNLPLCLIKYLCFKVILVF